MKRNLKFVLLLCVISASYNIASGEEDDGNERFVLLMCLSGLNAEDIASMPNLQLLRDRASYPNKFIPQYPGNAIPNAYSIATGLYPESHGVLGKNMFNKEQNRIISSDSPWFMSSHPGVVPLWDLNEQNNGVSACIMWPGCEVSYAANKVTYNVNYNSSYSLFDMVDLTVSFASATYTVESYRKFVLKHRTKTGEHRGQGYLPVARSSKLRGDFPEDDYYEGYGSRYWNEYDLVYDTHHPYSIEREEEYKIVGINTIDGIVDLEVMNEELRPIIDFGDAVQIADYYEDSNESPLIELVNRIEALNKDSSKSGSPATKYRIVPADLPNNSIYKLEKRARANLVMFYYKEHSEIALKHGTNSPRYRHAFKTLDSGIAYLMEQLKVYNLDKCVELIIISDHGTVALDNLMGKPRGPAIQDLDYSVGPEEGDRYSRLVINSRNKILDLGYDAGGNYYTSVEDSPLMNVWAFEGQTSLVHNFLMGSAKKLNFSVHLKEDLPSKYHFSNTARAPDIFVQADHGYAFTDKVGEYAIPGPWEESATAGLPVMIAAGPSFYEGFQGETISTVDIYSLVATLLGISKPPPTNGTLSNVTAMLRTPDGCLKESRLLIILGIVCGCVTGVLLLVVFGYLCREFCKTRKVGEDSQATVSADYRAEGRTVTLSSTSQVLSDVPSDVQQVSEIHVQDDSSTNTTPSTLLLEVPEESSDDFGDNSGSVGPLAAKLPSPKSYGACDVDGAAVGSKAIA